MPRRILLLVTDLEIGGTPTVVRELATRLHGPPEVEVEVACLANWGPVADQIKAAGVTVTALNAGSTFDLLVVRRLVRLIRGRPFDTVFSFLIHANAVAAAAKPFCRSVRFFQSIQTTQPTPRWHWRLQRRIHRAAEAVVVPSPSVAQVAHEWSGVPYQKVTVIPNAIDPTAYPRSPIPSLDPRPYPVGFIGRLDPIKRLPWLLAELHALQVVAPGILHFHVFGDGPRRAEVEADVSRYGMQSGVTLHGSVSRPQEALDRIGLLLLRSEAEGFGLVLIEAMAAGVPVLANDAPGIRDVVRHEQTGVLVHPASPAEVILGVRRIIEDRQLRDRLIASGLVEARERFSWDIVLPQYRDVLGLPHR